MILWVGRKVRWKDRLVMIRGRVSREHVLVSPVKRPEMLLMARRDQITRE